MFSKHEIKGLIVVIVISFFIGISLFMIVSPYMNIVVAALAIYILMYGLGMGFATFWLKIRNNNGD